VSVIDRFRASDPAPSQIAANKAEKNLRITKVRVLELIHTQGWLSSSEVNDQYLFASARLDWTRLAYDSPRKRAGELVDEGYLRVVDERMGANGAPESVYALTEKGKRVITLGGKKK
jgi:hypothetical protein